MPQSSFGIFNHFARGRTGFCGIAAINTVTERQGYASRGKRKTEAISIGIWSPAGSFTGGSRKNNRDRQRTQAGTP